MAGQVWKNDGQYDAYGTGTKVLVVLSGNPSSAKGAAAWATALYAKKFKGFGVGHVYSVAYHDHNTPPAELVTHFKGLVKDCPPVFVVAHSSGSYIAHAFFAQLDKEVLDKTTYYNVDGGYNEAGKNKVKFTHPPKNIFTIYAETTKGGFGSRNVGAMTGFGFHAKPRKMSYDLPDEVPPKADAAKAYLHRRLIVLVTPPPPQLKYEVVTDKNVTFDWIYDADKNL